MKRCNVLLCAFLCACLLVVFRAGPVIAGGDSPRGLTQNDFKYLAQGGFGDSANSYAWSVTSFKGDLYVGTNRHHLWSVLEGMSTMFSSLPVSPLELIDGPASDVWGDRAWADDFRGEIWRYRNGKWSMVYQAKVLQGILPIASNPALPPAPTINGYYPESYGYRNMEVYKGHIYAIGIGTWYPNMPLARILRSSKGDPGSWTDVSGIIATATNPRGLINYKGKLFISASLPGTALAGAGVGLVYCFDPTSPDLWKQVSDPGFGNNKNVEVPELAVFNGCLYASTVNHTTGFEVWKTDGSVLPNGKYIWKCVIKEGFGDTWNQWGMTMMPFNGYLYIGTAAGGGMVIKDNQPVGTRAFDVIRLDKKDHAKLLVGSYRPSDPPAGWPKVRVPLSKWSAGFANPFNAYVWNMCVYDGWLYLSTFDETSPILLYVSLLLEELKGNNGGAIDVNSPIFSQIKSKIQSAGTQAMSPLMKTMLGKLQLALGKGTADSITPFLSVMLKTFGGADVWKTRDGIHWVPVTLNGFDNYLNFGVRRLVPVQFGCTDALIVGTANAFTGYPRGGCEVLYAK